MAAAAGVIVVGASVSVATRVTACSTISKAVIDAAAAHAKGEPAQKLALDIEPSAVVVLSVEASPPPRSLASPKTSLEKLTHAWANTVYEAEGDLWERGDGSMLVVWVARRGIPETLAQAVQAAQALQQQAAQEQQLLQYQQ